MVDDPDALMTAPTTPAGRPLYPLRPFVSDDHFGAPAANTRWVDKANALTTAWTQERGTPPTWTGVVLCLAVAQHETLCGDAWAGEHNWGAVQKRRLTSAEQAVLTTAGIVPAPKNVTAARDALGRAVAAGQIPPLDHEALHIDSSPGKGWYFVYFWAYPNDVEGAVRFVHTLVGARRASVLNVIAPASGEAWPVLTRAVATTMYNTGYYEGFHDPHQEGGRDANITDYTTSLAKLAPAIATALKTAAWTPLPPAPESPPTNRLDTLAGVQAALGSLSLRLARTDFNPGPVDGVAGPRTLAAVQAFQRWAGLAVDGIVGPQTRAALQKALDATNL